MWCTKARMRPLEDEVKAAADEREEEKGKGGRGCARLDADKTTA